MGLFVAMGTDDISNEMLPVKSLTNSSILLKKTKNSMV
jgi:hypothetical protein